MKRDRYESEYERIRRKAGLARPEFPEPEQQPDPRPIDDDFRERMAETARIDAEKALERKVHADELTLRSNERVRLAEYANAGVEPLPGGISLALALHMGWKIEQVGDHNVLVEPPAQQRKRMMREEHVSVQSERSLKEGF